VIFSPININSAFVSPGQITKNTIPKKNIKKIILKKPKIHASYITKKGKILFLDIIINEKLFLFYSLRVMYILITNSEIDD